MTASKLFFLCCITFILSDLRAQEKDNKNRFYSDTTVESNGYKIRLEDTYVRKKLFIRTTVVVTNPGDKFLLIDKDNIVMSTEHIKGEASLYGRTIVVPPGETVKFPLKISAKDYQSPVITLNFSKLKVTNALIKKHTELQMPLEEKNEATSGGIHVTVIRAELKDEGLAVRIRVQYTGDYFITQNINSIGLLPQNQGPCLNFRKYKSKSYLNPNRNNELLWLLFPVDCARAIKRTERHLNFKSVFTEHSLESAPDISVSIRYLPGVEKNIDEEKEKEKEKVDEDHD